MSTVSPVARRLRSPSWFDLRLVVGVALVLASVLGGVAVVSAADRTDRFWAVTRDVSAGIVLTRDDVRPVAVRIAPAREAYFSTRTPVIGQTVIRSVAAGELLPRAAVGDATPSTTVTIPLSADVAPRIKAGQRITVWVSTKACPSATVLADTAVQSVQDQQGAGFGSAGGQDVVVRLDTADAERVIEALALKGGTIRAGLLAGGSAAAVSLPALSSCADATS
jgi:hypothetical protein